MPTPLLIGTDTNLRNGQAAAWTVAKAAVQNIVDVYDAIGLDPLTPEEFARLFNDTEALIFDKISGGEIGGLAVNKNVAMQLLAKPDGYDALIAALADFEHKCLNGGFRGVGTNEIARMYRAQVPVNFVLDEENEVQYGTKIQAHLDTIGLHYAKTDATIAVYNFLSDIVAAWYTRGLDAYYPDGNYSGASGNPIADLMTAITGIKNSDESFTVDVRRFAGDKVGLY